MRLLIIRHGESQADLLNVHEGRADFELTDRGHQQAQAMSKWVKENYNISKIYCSPLKRAYQTAQHLSDETDISLYIEDLLAEFNNGLIAGLSREEAAEKYPYQTHLALHESVYEQESQLQFRYRAEHVLSKILSENKEGTIVVITHGGMIYQLYRAFLGLPINTEVFVSTGDTGIHEWVIADGKKIIRASNKTDHLANKNL